MFVSGLLPLLLVLVTAAVEPPGVPVAPPDPDLERLRERYGERYRIHHLGHSWRATDRDPHTTTAPTLVADSPEQLEEQLEDPGPRWGWATLTTPRGRW